MSEKTAANMTVEEFAEHLSERRRSLFYLNAEKCQKGKNNRSYLYSSRYDGAFGRPLQKNMRRRYTK